MEKRGVDVKSLLANSEQILKGGGGSAYSNFWTPKEARSIVRLIPPNASIQGMLPGAFFVSNHEHNINGQRIGCAQEILQGESCPVCSERIRIYVDRKRNPESFTPQRQAFIDATNSSRRYLAMVIVRGEEEKGIQIWNFGYSMLQKLISFYQTYEDISDLDNGRDLIIVKTTKHVTDPKTGQIKHYPNYDNTVPAPNTSPAGSAAELNDWFNNQPHLLEVASKNIKPYDEVAAITRELLESIENEVHAPSVPEYTPPAGYTAPPNPNYEVHMAPQTPAQTVKQPETEFNIAAVLGQIDLSNTEAVMAFAQWQSNGNGDPQLLLEIAQNYPKPTEQKPASMAPQETIETRDYSDPEALLAEIDKELE